MVFVLGAYIYTSINSAKRIAFDRRPGTHEKILESRRRLGMDAWDQKKERERLRGEMNVGKGKESVVEEVVVVVKE